MRLALALLLLLPSLAWAQPSVTFVEEVDTDTNATSYTIPSHSVTGDRLLILTIGTVSGTTLPDPTITGHSLTWTRAQGVTSAPSEIHLYCAISTANSTDTIVIDYGAVTMSRQRAAIFEVSGADLDVVTNCEDSLLQQVTYSATDTTSSTLTFAAYNDSANRPFVMLWKAISTASAGTAEVGWSEVVDQAGAGESGGMLVMWRNDASDTTGTVTWTEAGSAGVLGIGVEIVDAPSTAADIQMGTGMSSGGFMD